MLHNHKNAITLQETQIRKKRQHAKKALKKSEKKNPYIQYLNNFVGKCLYTQQQSKARTNIKIEQLTIKHYA